MKLIKNICLVAIVMVSFLMSGCDKTKPYDIDVSKPRAHFIGNDKVTVQVVDQAPAVTIQVGTTDVSGADRQVSFSVISPSGATAGSEYTLVSGNSVTIPANKALADITIQPNFAAYAAGRRDTLILAIVTPSVEAAAFSDTLTLIFAGPSTSGCDEANPDLNSLLGDYANTNELLGTSAYGPYTTSISSITPTSPTTATIVVENIWDNGWGPISFDIDWTDPANRTVTCVQQDAIPGSDAGDLNATYAGQTISVRQNATSGPGTYNACGDPVFVLNMQLGVTATGWFNVLYAVTLER